MLVYKPGTTGKYRSIDDTDDCDYVFTEREFLSLLETAQTVSMWNFANALGDTIKEKAESLYLMVIDVARTVARKIDKEQYFWLAIPPTMTTLFHTFMHDSVEYQAMGGIECKYLGIMGRVLKVYECPVLPDDKMLVGCGNEVMSEKHYARITISDLFF